MSVPVFGRVPFYNRVQVPVQSGIERQREQQERDLATLVLLEKARLELQLASFYSSQHTFFPMPTKRPKNDDDNSAETVAKRSKTSIVETDVAGYNANLGQMYNHNVNNVANLGMGLGLNFGFNSVNRVYQAPPILGSNPNLGLTSLLSQPHDQYLKAEAMDYKVDQDELVTEPDNESHISDGSKKKQELKSLRERERRSLINEYFARIHSLLNAINETSDKEMEPKQQTQILEDLLETLQAKFGISIPDFFKDDVQLLKEDKRKALLADSDAYIAASSSSNAPHEKKEQRKNMKCKRERSRRYSMRVLSSAIGLMVKSPTHKDKLVVLKHAAAFLEQRQSSKK